MKKTSLLFIIIVLSTFSCAEKEVELSPIDILTGGKKREWKITEFIASGQDAILTESCYSDDTAIFSKGDTASSLNPTYTWKKNFEKCGLTDVDLNFPFVLNENSDPKQLFFNLNQLDPYNILILEHDEIYLVTPDNQRRLRFKPLESSSDSTKARRGSY